MTLEQVGGMGGMEGLGGNSMGSFSNGGESGGKQKSSLFGGLSSPLTSGVNMMWWITKNILLFYVFLLFITVVPSLPIIIYITIFYFIINGLIGRIKTL
jgi:hypothetical protein